VRALGDQLLIGQSVLRRFRLTLDHGKQVILFSPWLLPLTNQRWFALNWLQVFGNAEASRMG